MLAAIALLTVGVAMLGAYAPVAGTLRRRRTELVLHRLHSAAHIAVAHQVAAEFAGPLLLAAPLGLPLATWLGHRYLAGFVDRINPTTGLVLPILGAVAAALFHHRIGGAAPGAAGAGTPTHRSPAVTRFPAAPKVRSRPT